MSAELERSAALIEALLGDAGLRARFRADPDAVLREHGLGDLAGGPAAGAPAMLTLELRESRSSLAGVIVAAAAEGVDFGQVAEHALPRMGGDAGRALGQLISRLGSHHHHAPAAPAQAHHPAPVHRAAPAAPHLRPVGPLPEMQKRPVVHHHVESVRETAPAEPRHQAAVPAPAVPTEPAETMPSDPLDYPGDAATQAQLAGWMGANAVRAGLPPELPVMAALTESGLRNLDYGDRDSLGFFQMRSSIWDEGAYAGYPSDPQLQMNWFISEALAVRRSDPALAESPSNWGEWVADIERPAEQYRYRYQLQFDEAQQLLRASGVDLTAGGVGMAASGHAVDHVSLGHAVSHTASTCVGAHCTAGGSDPGTGLDGAGLVRFAFGRHGVQLPPTLTEQFQVGDGVPRADLRPGDAVFFGRSAHEIETVGLYVGHGRVITATSQQHAVSIASLDGTSLHYIGARRYSEKLLAGASSYARTLPTVKR